MLKQTNLTLANGPKALGHQRFGISIFTYSDCLNWALYPWATQKNIETVDSRVRIPEKQLTMLVYWELAATAGSTYGMARY